MEHAHTYIMLRFVWMDDYVRRFNICTDLITFACAVFSGTSCLLWVSQTVSNLMNQWAGVATVLLNMNASAV